MITGNEFVTIRGYEDLYKINKNGVVISSDRKIAYPNGRTEVRSGRIMKSTINNKNGYSYIRLTDKNGKQKGFRLHRLVAIAFLPNPLNLPEVNHEDFNKQNNSADNLKWCDRYYQNQHAATKPNRKWQKHRLGMTGSRNPKSKPVIVLSMDGANVGYYESGLLAAKATNSDQTKVSSCCLGKINSHNNLKFQFA